MKKKSSKISKYFYEEIYCISSKYYNNKESLHILICADLHYHENVNKKIYDNLIKYCEKIKPDFIILPGDLIETIDFIENKKEKDYFESILKNMAEISIVIIIPGNHEIAYFTKKAALNKNKIITNKIVDYLESLSKFKNVYFLNNSSKSFKNISFIGFSPSLETYFGNNEFTTKVYLGEFKKNFKLDKNKFNVILTHSSNHLTNKFMLEEKEDIFKYADLVISAHLHDGYLPKIFDKITNNRIGLYFTPLLSPIPGIVSRGMEKFGRGYLFVSQGFRKWTANVGLLNILDRFWAKDVERIIIKK